MTLATKRTWIASLCLALPGALLGASAQPAIAPPQLGFVQDSARALRPAFGLAGNFILGPSLALGSSIKGHVITGAFSGSLGLLKTDSSLAAFDAQGKLLASMDIGPGAALFAFSPGGATALAYIPSSNSLIEWRGTAFAPVLVNCEVTQTDMVLAIAFPNPFQASLIVQREPSQGTSELWEVDLPLGTIGAVSQNALIGVHAPLLALPTGELVYSDTQGIVVRKPDSTEVHIAASVPASFSLQQMSQDWVQLTDLNSSARFAIHATPGREAFYRLPSGDSE